MDLILTGRRVDADEALHIGLCEYVVPEGKARDKAEALAHDIARFPQSCMRADRRSVRTQHGLSMHKALRQEWKGSKAEVTIGIEGAARFTSGKGRGAISAMYELNLKTSHAQSDLETREITIGALLREVAGTRVRLRAQVTTSS